MNENDIRDILANNLAILEDGLQLLDIEKFIPSTLGTRSFIDILAKDSSGHWVIIEVKKTNAAAREAAHEVFKYVESIQRHFGARNDEIRAIVVSVEWAELLVPFSRFLSETSIAIEGFRLLLGDHGEDFQALPIEPIPVNKSRYLAPWHELNLYQNKSNLERGIISYDECCRNKAITDYILVAMKAASDFNSQAAERLITIAERMGMNGDGFEEFIMSNQKTYEYIIYFAPQILSKELCLNIIAHDANLIEEVEGVIENLDENAELCILHQNVYDVDPWPYRDYLEIGYAAKFRLLVDEGWTIERILRRGLFERNELLSDDAIIEELKGSTGSSGRSFRRSITLANRAHVSSAWEGVEAALASNPAWKAQIRRVLDAITEEVPDGCASLNVFSPSSGIFTLYFMATEEDSLRYIPQYEVAVHDANGDLKTVYLGLLVPSGEPIGFIEVLKKYYEGQLGRLMFLASVGFYEPRDADVLDDLGLIYKTFRLDNPSGELRWFELKDDRWKSFEPKMPFQPLQSYFDKYASLIVQIVDSIGSRMFGGFHDMS
jgi:Endonuclease NucS